MPGHSTSPKASNTPSRCSRIKTGCFGFFPTGISLVAGGFAGVGIETTMGSLGVDFLSLTGALPALGVLIPTVLLSYGLAKTFKKNTAALMSTQFFLGASAVVLSKAISATLLALDANAPLDPLLPYLISASATLLALLIIMCIFSIQKLSSLTCICGGDELSEEKEHTMEKDPVAEAREKILARTPTKPTPKKTNPFDEEEIPGSNPFK